MRYQPLIPAHLHHNAEGVPYSADYEDVYHSAGGALTQAQRVFLAGNSLPERWARRDSFVILETGFGLGHNFLATWAAWRADPAACRRLHFISVEKHPFSAQDLALAHEHAKADPALSEELRAQWPLLVPGFHRIEFDNACVVLTLLFGDAQCVLPECQADVDAIFLDGFSPSKNADMWSSEVFAALFRLAKPGATLATWSVSGSVKRGLREAGFEVSKANGFDSKREMLRGYKAGTLSSAQARPKRAIVIGAGLAGTAIAERLTARGWRITMIEEAGEIAQGASGNIAGAFRPLPSIDDNFLARITRTGFSYALAHLHRLANSANPVRWQACGVLHVARDAKQESKLQQAVQQLCMPDDFFRYVSCDEASALAGQRTAFGAWWFPRGGWINPPSQCAAQLAAGGQDISLHLCKRADRIEYADGMWSAFSESGIALAQAEILILANAHDAARLAHADWLPLRAARGQVSHLPSESMPALKTVVCGSGYVTPPIDGKIATGASFLVDDASLAPRMEEHEENLEKLSRMLPAYGGILDARTLDGRVGQRPISPDRLPIVGALPQPGLHILSGFGARGLVWGNLCAELLASQLNEEPLPIEKSLADALSPARFLLPKTTSRRHDFSQ